MRPYWTPLLSATLLLQGCKTSSVAAPEAASPEAHNPSNVPVIYAYESLDARAVSVEAFRNRATILIFITTYGDPSLIQARFLKKIFLEHVPRINAAAIVMERIDNRPLAYIFREVLQLPYPLAMADAPTIEGKGSFIGVDTVPSVVVLDAQGREVWRKVGLAYPHELNDALKHAGPQ